MTFFGFKNNLFSM